MAFNINKIFDILVITALISIILKVSNAFDKLSLLKLTFYIANVD